MAKKSVNFKRTNELDAKLKAMVKDYYGDRGLELRKDKLRRERNKLVSAIEKGARRIKIAAVAGG